MLSPVNNTSSFFVLKFYNGGNTQASYYFPAVVVNNIIPDTTPYLPDYATIPAAYNDNAARFGLNLSNLPTTSASATVNF